MIDTHCHLTFEGLQHRVNEVIDAARDAGVTRMISVGTSPDESRRALEIAQRFDGVFATAGLHPLYVEQWPDRLGVVEPLRELAEQRKLVALGEMGLDRHYTDPPLEKQRRAFAWQLELASELPDLPIIIHNRKATDATLAMIRDSGLPGERFVFHCFTGSAEELDAILALGAWVSFTGIVTFKNSQALAEASDRVPLDRLMIETDSPYLTPEPHRKVRPNEPRYVADVARFLAARRGLSLDDFAAATDGNADRFFGLPARRV